MTQSHRPGRQEEALGELSRQSLTTVGEYAKKAFRVGASEQQDRSSLRRHDEVVTGNLAGPVGHQASHKEAHAWTIRKG